jgi:hypothetical protein
VLAGLKICGGNEMLQKPRPFASLLACVAACFASLAVAQPASLSPTCVKQLRVVATASDEKLWTESRNLFKANCEQIIVDAFGASGVPNSDDTSALAMAALAWRASLDKKFAGSSSVASAVLLPSGRSWAIVERSIEPGMKLDASRIPKAPAGFPGKHR